MQTFNRCRVHICDNSTHNGFPSGVLFDNINRRDFPATIRSLNILCTSIFQNETIITIQIFIDFVKRFLICVTFGICNHTDFTIQVLTPITHIILKNIARSIVLSANRVIHLLVLNLMNTLRYTANCIQCFIAGGTSFLNLVTKILPSRIKFTLKILHTIKQSMKSYINELLTQCSVHLRSSQNGITTHQRFHNVPAEIHKRIRLRLTRQTTDFHNTTQTIYDIFTFLRNSSLNIPQFEES